MLKTVVSGNYTIETWYNPDFGDFYVAALLTEEYNSTNRETYANVCKYLKHGFSSLKKAIEDGRGWANEQMLNLQL
jgi:hypothetical protein